MTTLNVQFADDTEGTIVTYFCLPQNAEYYPNLGTVDINDARWKTFYAAMIKSGIAELPAPDAP